MLTKCLSYYVGLGIHLGLCAHLPWLSREALAIANMALSNTNCRSGKGYCCYSHRPLELHRTQHEPADRPRGRSKKMMPERSLTLSSRDNFLPAQYIRSG